MNKSETIAKLATIIQDNKISVWALIKIVFKSAKHASSLDNYLELIELQIDKKINKRSN